MFVQSQSVYVSSAHRYWNFQWSEARNREVYGAQASVEGVGSNLRLEIAVQVNENSGDADLRAAVAELKKLADHRCFFADVAAFAEAPSTLEAVTQYLAQKLFSQAPPAGRWAYLTVAENEHLSCTVFPGSTDVEMRIRVLNLEMSIRRDVDSLSGLALDRREAWDSVRAVAPGFAEPAAAGEAAWAESLRQALEIKVKGLSELRIDLGSQRFIRVRS
jgi:hypothetical protein